MKTNKTVNRDNATIKPKTNMKTPKTEPASNTSVYDPGEINHPPTVSMNAPSASRPTTVVAANDSKSIVLTPSVPLHETVAQALPSETITGHPGKTGNGAKISSKPSKLTKAQRKAEARCAATIRQYRAGKAKDFHNLVAACYEVQRDELYCDYPTQAAYFKAEFDLSRSASLRLAQMGKILDRLSPIGDIAALLPADSHVRPLLTLTEEQQDAVLTKVSGWKKVANLLTTPSKLILAARTFLYPPSGPRDEKDTAKTALAAKFIGAVENAKSKLSSNVGTEVVQVFEKLFQTVKDIGAAILRSTGIAWTQKTWNPLHGCTRASSGCDNCYAARQTATRLADLYPGLAVKKTTAAGTITYAFTGKIQLAPEDLAEPLLDHDPKMIFVNSMSDLFHKDVPEEFIDDVFTVMELAHWHVFQVVTKRPERQAQYTQKRYADKAPPNNIWLATSTEDQAAYDERIPHLRNTKAAIRWLSVEPLLGPIDFGSMDGIDWVVVGGESGHNARPMAKAWATDIRDACKTAGAPFFFKQWGAFGEQGHKAKKIKHSGPATLDGVVHHEYPKR